MSIMTKANNLFVNGDEGGDINGKWKFKVSSVNAALLMVGQQTCVQWKLSSAGMLYNKQLQFNGWVFSMVKSCLSQNKVR